MSLSVTPSSGRKMREAVNAVTESKKEISFAVEKLTPVATSTRLVLAFLKEHDPKMDAASGVLQITCNETEKFNSIQTYEVAKKIVKEIEKHCHVHALSIRCGSGKGCEVKFSWYDNEPAFKYRH